MIEFKNVVRSYNGRSGCMCGCNGKYTIAPDVSLDLENELVGYEAYDENDVSERRVKIAVTKLNKYIAANGIDISKPSPANGPIIWTDEWVSLDLNGRTTTVYFK